MGTSSVDSILLLSITYFVNIENNNILSSDEVPIEGPKLDS